MKCDNCPAAWEQGGMTSYGYECDSYGCLIRGLYYGGEGESCYLTKGKVQRRLDELKQYANGDIKRPKWLLQRFLRELTSQMDTVQCGLPGFPPLWQKKGGNDDCDNDYCIIVKPLYGSTDWHYQRESDKRKANEKLENIKKQIADFKKAVKSESSDYLTGYISALSAVEGMIAEVENEKDSGIDSYSDDVDRM